MARPGVDTLFVGMRGKSKGYPLTREGAKIRYGELARRAALFPSRSAAHIRHTGHRERLPVKGVAGGGQLGKSGDGGEVHQGPEAEGFREVFAPSWG